MRFAVDGNLYVLVRDAWVSDKMIKGGTVFQAAIPSNWTTLSSKSAIRAVPENGYGDVNGKPVFSHGVEFGVAPPGSRDLQQAKGLFVQLDHHVVVAADDQ